MYILGMLHLRGGEEFAKHLRWPLSASGHSFVSTRFFALPRALIRLLLWSPMDIYSIDSLIHNQLPSSFVRHPTRAGRSDWARRTADSDDEAGKVTGRTRLSGSARES